MLDNPRFGNFAVLYLKATGQQVDLPALLQYFFRETIVVISVIIRLVLPIAPEFILASLNPSSA